MKPTQINNVAVRARCPDCNGALSVFDFRDSGREFGYVFVDGRLGTKREFCLCAFV